MKIEYFTLNEARRANLNANKRILKWKRQRFISMHCAASWTVLQSQGIQVGSLCHWLAMYSVPYDCLLYMYSEEKKFSENQDFLPRPMFPVIIYFFYLQDLVAFSEKHDIQLLTHADPKGNGPGHVQYLFVI